MMNIHTLFNPRSSRLKWARSQKAGAMTQLQQSQYFLQQCAWALTIGNFDGVHRGHQMLLDQLKQQADAFGGLQAVMVFEPQPLEYLKGADAPARLMGMRDKVQALFATGVDLVLLCGFTEKVMRMSPERFMVSLCRHLNVKGLVLGQDFKFGYQQQGDMVYLRSYGRQHAIQVYAMPDFLDGDIRVSSSLIRRSICQNKFEEASLALGRPFLLTGKIKHGMKLARGFGFPTANLHMTRCSPPVSGVFVGRAQLPYNDSSQKSGVWLKAIANAGSKPTVHGTQWQIEVHIFDEDKYNESEGIQSLKNDCYYGLRLAFEPLAKLRNEKRFSGLADLEAAIAEDVNRAKAYFKQPYS